MCRQHYRLISKSTWTHSALYIGRPQDIAEPALREVVPRLQT